MREVCNAEWDDIQDRLREKDADIDRLNKLITRAADALEKYRVAYSIYGHDDPLHLIAELRKAAQ
jgi:hypothetical protein